MDRWVRRSGSWGLWACLLVACGGNKTEEFGVHSRGEPTVLSDSHQAPASGLDIAINGSGQALVYWTDYYPMQSQLRVARYTPRVGWEPAEVLTSGGTLGSYRVAIDESGNALATWTQGTATERSLVMASRFAADAGWSTPEPLEDDATVDAIEVALSMNPGGEAIAVWSDTYTSHVVRARRFDPDAGWGSTETISTTSSGFTPLYAAGVVLCGDGSAVAMWGTEGPMETQPLFGIPMAGVYVNRYTPNDGWAGAASAGVGIIEGSPELRCDGEGRVAAAWSAPAHPQSSTFFAREAASGWDGGMLHLGSYDAPLALTAAGDAIVVLNDQFENGPVEAFLDTTSAGLVEQRIESKTDGKVSSIDLAANADGKALAIWSRAAHDGDDIWINERQAETGWGKPERLVETVPRCGEQCSSDTAPRAAMDAAGNTIVAWVRRHDSHADAVAQVLPP